MAELFASEGVVLNEPKTAHPCADKLRVGLSVPDSRQCQYSGGEVSDVNYC